MSIPSKVKESSHMRGSSGHMVSFVLKFAPKGITLVLSKFACNPDILLKELIYWTHAFNDAIHLSIKSEVSSVKVCALISSSVWSFMPALGDFDQEDFNCDNENEGGDYFPLGYTLL